LNRGEPGPWRTGGLKIKGKIKRELKEGNGRERLPDARPGWHAFAVPE